MNSLHAIIIVVFMLLSCGVQGSGVDQKIYDLKYRTSVSAWTIDFVIQRDGYETCIQLVNACCFLPDQVIKATLTTTSDSRQAIQFKGSAKGNCPNELILQIVGYHSNSDLSYRYGRYSFLSNIGLAGESLNENAKNQFLLAIDDQLNEYTFKLPSLADKYSDNDSYNYAKVLVYNTDSSSSAKQSWITLTAAVIALLLF